MAAGSFAVASSNQYVSCTCWWSSTSNTAGNYSTVNFELRASRTNSGYTTYGTGSGSVTINGTPISFSIASSQKITQNSNTLLGSGSVTVYHNDDGTKNVTISAYASIPGAGLTLGTTSTTVSLDTIPRASTFGTISGQTIGANMTVNISRASSSFIHTLWYRIGNSAWYEFTNVGTSKTFTIDKNLCKEITRATSGTMELCIRTYQGSTQIGSDVYKNLTVYVPEDVVPTVSFTMKDEKGYLETYGKYIQGKSMITLEITAKGSYGSQIQTYETIIDGKTYSKAKIENELLMGSGKQTVIVTVTDSRGRKNESRQDIEIFEYKAPCIKAATATRCDEDGTSNLKGKYIKLVFSSSITPLENQNSATYLIEYKKSSGSSSGEKTISEYENQYDVADGQYIFPAEKEAYTILLTVADGIDSDSKRVVGPSETVLWSRLWKGLGYAIGKFAELEGVFDVGFRTRLSGGILHLILEAKTDLDDVLTPNVYAGQDIAIAKYLNVPSEFAEGKFTLDVVSCGDNGELKQTFSTCSKNNSQVYVRFYYDGEWGEWINQNINVYPVGSIYMSVNSTNPSQLFGGTWTQLKDRFLLGSGDSYLAGATGGSAAHKLKESEMPSHRHSTSDSNTSFYYGQDWGTGWQFSAYSSAQYHWVPYTGYSGGGQAHNNMPPYLVVYMWVRTA